MILPIGTIECKQAWGEYKQMSSFTESEIEIFSLDEIKQLGFTHIPDFSHGTIFFKLMSG